MVNWEEKASKASKTGRFGTWSTDAKRHTHGALVGEQIRDRVDAVHNIFKVGPDGRWATSMSKNNEQGNQACLLSSSTLATTLTKFNYLT